MINSPVLVSWLKMPESISLRNSHEIIEKIALNSPVCPIEIKDSCLALADPEHGKVRCSRSRHSSQLFYRTKCSFRCDNGYTLIGPSDKYCNGSDGSWDNTEVTCVRKFIQLFFPT